MFDFKDKMDSLRRAGQAEAADKFFKTAPGKKGLPSRGAGQQKAVIAKLEERSLPPAEVVPSSGMFDVSAPEVEKYFADTSEPPTQIGPKIVEGTAGYVYEKLDDGSFKIVKSPRSKGGQIIRPGDKYFADIKRDFEAHAAGSPQLA